MSLAERTASGDKQASIASVLVNSEICLPSDLEMASSGLPPGTTLEDVMSQLQAIQQKQDELLSVVDSLSQGPATHSPTVGGLRPSPVPFRKTGDLDNDETAASSAAALASTSTATPPLRPADSPSGLGTASPTNSGFTSRIILT